MSDSENVVKFPDPDAVEAEAAEWVVRLDGGDLPADEFGKFLEWQSRSPLHREAAQRLSTLWANFDGMRNFAVVLPVNVQQRRDFWQLPRRNWRTIAAAAVAVFVIGTGFLYSHLRAVPPLVLDYETIVGGQKTVALPDGSTMIVNTDSKLQVVFSSERRDVRIQRGEAFFVVAHKDTRPFTVIAGDNRVRDIGTAFDVWLRPQAVEVTVTQGSVELAGLAEQRLGVLAAGQKAAFNHRIEYLRSLSDADINRQLAWRQGILVYRGEPLSKVVADVGRYTNVTIDLANAQMASVSVGGYFEIGKLNALLEALESNFGIHARWEDSTHVRLETPADTPKSPAR